jgi:hypothetical protein
MPMQNSPRQRRIEAHRRAESVGCLSPINGGWPHIECLCRGIYMQALVPRFSAPVDPRLLQSIRNRISLGFKVSASALVNLHSLIHLL